MFPDSLLFLAGFVKRYYAVVSLPHICRRWLHRKACENDQRCFVFFVFFLSFLKKKKNMHNVASLWCVTQIRHLLKRGWN